MAKNTKQVYDGNPTTTVPDNALIYLALSPYGTANDSAVKAQDIFPANGAVTDGALTAFNGTSGKKLKTIGAMTTGQIAGGVTAGSVKPFTLTAGTNITSVVTDTGASTITINAATQSLIPLNYKNGFNLTSIGNTEVTILPGQCANSDNTATLTTVTSKTIEFADSGAGGLDTGVFALNTWYGTYVIWEAANPSNWDVIGSLNNGIGTVPAVMPAPYNKARFVGSVKSGADALLLMPYTQTGSGNDRYCTWASSDSCLLVLENGASNVPAAVSCANAVSPSSRLCLALNCTFEGGTDATNRFGIFQTGDLTYPYIYISPGNTTLISADGTTSAVYNVPIDSSHNFYYSIDPAVGGAQLTFIVVRGFMESV